MNRRTLADFIASWLRIAVPSIALCGCLDCPLHVHRIVTLAELADGGTISAGSISTNCADTCRNTLHLQPYQDVLGCGPTRTDGGEQALDCFVTQPCAG